MEVGVRRGLRSLVTAVGFGVCGVTQVAGAAIPVCEVIVAGTPLVSSPPSLFPEPCGFGFQSFPSPPVAGEEAELRTISSRAYSVFEWDLENDGVFDATTTLSANGLSLFTKFTAPGERTIRARASGEAGGAVRQATLVAFSPGPEARRAEWRSLLDRVFEPVAIEIHQEAVATPVIEADGAVLLIPAIADDSALRLRFARRGRRLFGSAELTTIHEILALVTAAESARAEYARGVNEERQRIARDLHDDVSSLLLTGLHRREVDEVRGDVRQALGEIRTMVSSLAQPEVGLATILADLRFETAERLRAAGIVMTWTGGAGQPEEAVMLDYSRHKALVSGVREAVSNIVRHAAADAVSVDIAISDAGLTVDIADDGRGLSPQSGSRNSGHGLASLNQRLSEVGGRFTLAALGRGCLASLIIPLPAGRAG